jgi:hypothetical protein
MSGGGGGGTTPSFNPVIQFAENREMEPHQVDGSITLTVDPIGQVVGKYSIGCLIADGENVPALSDDFSIANSWNSGYKNEVGIHNYYATFYSGEDYWIGFYQ